MNYYIADMHLFCKSQTQEGRLNFDNRPFQNTEEMHQHFLEEWNKQITNGDTIYILGDLSLRGRNDEFHRICYYSRDRCLRAVQRTAGYRTGDQVVYTNVIYESEKPEPVKGRKKPTQIHVNSIMPDRPFLQERMAKVLADMVLQQIREDDLKEIKRKAHTPNWISADAMFAAVSTACIPDNAEKAQTLKSKLLKDAEMKSDWPLHICSKTDKNTESTIDVSTSLDCSEYMLFHRY